MKKIILAILGVICIIFVVHKVYHGVVSYKIYTNLENFMAEENRMYQVSMKDLNNIKNVQTVYRKNDIINCIKENDNKYCEWYNFITNENYSFNMNTKTVYRNTISLFDTQTLFNLPHYILELTNNSKIKEVFAIFNIKYITLEKFEDKMCYKIVTKNENIFVDCSTYLPVYSKMKVVNSNNDQKNYIENFYEFEIGNVTDEEVELPNLEEYTIIENEK